MFAGLQLNQGNLRRLMSALGFVSSFRTSVPGLTPQTGTTGDVTLGGTVAVSGGGTGATTLAAKGILYGNGTSAIGATAAGAAGQILVGGTDPKWLGAGTSGYVLVAAGAGVDPAWSPVSGLGLVATWSGGSTGLTPATATSGNVTLAGTLNVANGGTGVTTSTGTGSVVLSTSPTLVTPALGTPSALVLTNATGTPASIGLANGSGLPVAGISGLGTGVATFLATPSSANLAAAVTDETGSGALVFGTGPTLSNPIVGTQAAFTNNTRAASCAYADRIGVQQIVTAATSTASTGTTVIPTDNTIPQQTEGDQYLSASITPKSATSTLVIEATVYGSTNALATWAAALFQDSTANALTAGAYTQPVTNYAGCIVLRYVMASGTTSATTFKVRAGPNVAATLTVNGLAGAGIFGAIPQSRITITEYGA